MFDCTPSFIQVYIWQRALVSACVCLLISLTASNQFFFSELIYVNELCRNFPWCFSLCGFIYMYIYCLVFSTDVSVFRCLVFCWAAERFNWLFNWIIELSFTSFVHVFLRHSWHVCHEEHSNFLNLFVCCSFCWLSDTANKLSFENLSALDSSC